VSLADAFLLGVFCGFSLAVVAVLVGGLLILQSHLKGE